jgi:poly-gamma-glutamate capsule biosynthesis protein CapA/YwtB (metallophosphatase superfamily)
MMAHGGKHLRASEPFLARFFSNKKRDIVWCLSAAFIALLLFTASAFSPSGVPSSPQLSVAQASSSDAKAPAEPVRITLAFTGDLMAHQNQIDRARTKDGYDFTPSFTAVKDILSDADFTVGNFETTLDGPQSGYTGYPCFNAPDAFAEAIKGAGYDLIMTSNNHCLDRHFHGLVRTVDTLQKMGFFTVGTYRTKSESEKPPLVCSIDGVKIAFVSWTYGTNGIKLPKGKEWAISYLDTDAVSRDMARARAESPDMVIALVHAGTEYLPEPPENVKKVVSQLIACGADAVIAGHPHVLQKFEFVKSNSGSASGRNVFVAWSMGNFISFQRTKPRDVGAILRLTVKKSQNGTQIVSADVTPTWVQIHQSGGGDTVRVLPIASALKEPDKWGMGAGDTYRVIEAHSDLTKRILGAYVKPERAKLSYEIR